MRVKRISRENFMIPGTHTLELPERGLVLITGDNGTGKSSWIDAVGSVWNLTLRDPKARKARGNLEDCQAHVTIDTYEGETVKRVWAKSGKCAIDWSTIDTKDTGTTRTKSQKSLAATIGDFQGWRWSNVISSDSADSFTTATPSKRRVILEDVLDLHLLALAYTLAHEDTKKYKRDKKEQERALTAAKESAELLAQSELGAKTAFEGLPAPLYPDVPLALEAPRKPQEPSPTKLVVPDPPSIPTDLEGPGEPPEDTRPALTEKVTQLRLKLAQCTSDLSSLEAMRTRLDAQKSRQHAKVKAAEEAHAKVRSEECPTCSQEITEQTAQSFLATVTEARSEAKASSKELDEDMQETLLGIQRIQQKAEDLKAKCTKAEEDLSTKDSIIIVFDQTMAHFRRAVEMSRSDYEAEVARWETSKAALESEYHTRILQDSTQFSSALAQYEQDLTNLEERNRVQQEAYKAKCAQVRNQHTSRKLELECAYQEAQKRNRKAHEVLRDAKESLESTTSDLELCLCAEEVLGPEGTRATLLNAAMKSIEMSANSVLCTIGSHIRLDLYAEGKDVGLRVVGDCGSEYVDLSNGERRRVDLAVLLALGEVASTTRGLGQGGTLFLDEFLDGVDHTGLQDVCDYVTWLATRRCVVVVTHFEEVASKLRVERRVVMKR